jgi:hypothetical protein
MVANQRHPFPFLEFGVLRVSGMSSEIESPDRSTLRIERIEVRDVKLQTPLGLVSAALATLTNVTADLRTAPQVGGSLGPFAGVTVGELRLEGASVEQVVVPPLAVGGPRKTWRLDPLGSLDGTLHADITDAAWVFDADVTIPISHGRIDFNRATVEHVGPDSSIGLSPMGIYVDAPNGRTYLYRLSASHVPGATFERRGVLLASWTADRGSLDLQPFVECLLSGMPIGALATGTRDMIARTRVNAELRLGDGVIGDDRNHVLFAGRDQGNNAIELSSPSGAGLVARMPQLSALESRCEIPGAVISTGALSATLSVQAKGFSAATSASASVAELTLHNFVCAPEGREMCGDVAPSTPER